MKVMLHVLFATACVAAVVGQGPGQSHCTSISWGEEKGAQIKLPIVDFTSGLRDWQVKIPVASECSVVNGLDAVSCDTDVTPDSSFLNDYLVYVHRNGDLEGVGSIHVTLYCN